jgi:hypothetical protein
MDFFDLRRYADLFKKHFVRLQTRYYYHYIIIYTVVVLDIVTLIF